MYKFLTKNGQTIAFAVGAVLVIAFYALVVGDKNYDTFTTMDMDGVKDPERMKFTLFNFGLVSTVALIAIGAILMFGFGLFQAATNIKGSLGAIVGLAVIAIIFALVYLEANSISEIILMFFLLISVIISVLSATPGLLTIKSDDNIKLLV